MRDTIDALDRQFHALQLALARKALAHAAWSAVADGAATLRQNRPARPIGGLSGGSVDTDSTPVLA